MYRFLSILQGPFKRRTLVPKSLPTSVSELGTVVRDRGRKEENRDEGRHNYGKSPSERGVTSLPPEVVEVRVYHKCPTLRSLSPRRREVHRCTVWSPGTIIFPSKDLFADSRRSTRLHEKRKRGLLGSSCSQRDSTDPPFPRFEFRLLLKVPHSFSSHPDLGSRVF